jgi:hypothetical protein
VGTGGVMAGSEFIRHQDIEILYLDFSYTTSKEEVVQIVEEAKQLIANRPPLSVLTLTNITKAYLDRDISQILKELAVHNKPFVKAGAVIGVTPTRKMIYLTVLFFAKRKLEICDDLDSAKAWLLLQA